MNDRERATIAAWGMFLAVPLMLLAALPLDRALVRAGRDDLADLVELAALPLLLGIVSAAIVGVALATRHPRHPVGWLFLGLADLLALSAFADGYGRYGALVRTPPLPGASAVAVYGDTSFVGWSVVLGLILLLTPTGRPPTPRWRWLQWTLIGSGVTALLLHLVSNAELEPPVTGVRNPMAIVALGKVPMFGGFVGILVSNVAFLVAGASVVVRFRRAQGEERRQLLWLVPVALALPVAVIASIVAALANQQTLVLVTAGIYVALVPVGAALSITKYHLYEVDRLVSRATSYVLVSGVVVVVYALVAIGGGRLLAVVGGESDVAIAVATLVAAGIAGPARRRLQDATDRRFNRRRFEALVVVRDHVRHPDPDVSMEAVLRQALADPSLAVAYRIDGREQWVSDEGQVVDALPAGVVEVRRAGRLVAAVSGTAATETPELVASVAAEAAPELESTRLRAAVALQLVEVQQSRARLVTAQLDERKKIERNLHDGAQQRLVALALYLGMAASAEGTEEMRGAIDTARGEAKAAVQELRELANGLHPAILTNGGLVAAVEGLTTRTPLPIRAEVTDERFPPEIEAAAWFITCEAVANAVKHAGASGLDLSASRRDGSLVVIIRDDGSGGARPEGTGIRGIADRAEAIGGTLTVESSAGVGTTICAVFPLA